MNASSSASLLLASHSIGVVSAGLPLQQLRVSPVQPGAANGDWWRALRAASAAASHAQVIEVSLYGSNVDVRQRLARGIAWTPLCTRVTDGVGLSAQSLRKLSREAQLMGRAPPIWEDPLYSRFLTHITPRLSGLSANRARRAGK